MNRSRHDTKAEGEQSEETILTLLGDPTSREILRATKTEPRSASELETRCDASLSSIYRKIDALSNAGLVDERIRITKSGKHTTEYVSLVERVELSLSQEGSFTVTVDESTAESDEESPGELTIAQLSGGTSKTASSNQQSRVPSQDD